MDGTTTAEAFFHEMMELAACTQDVGEVDPSENDPRKNGLRAPFPPGVVAKMAYVFSERTVLLREGCQMPRALYERFWRNRFKYAQN